MPGLTGFESPIAWISEGLLVTTPGDPGLGVVRLVNVATGQQRVWEEILPQDRAGIMTFVSFRATPDGAAHAYRWHRALSNLYTIDGLL